MATPISETKAAARNSPAPPHIEQPPQNTQSPQPQSTPLLDFDIDQFDSPPLYSEEPLIASLTSTNSMMANHGRDSVNDVVEPPTGSQRTPQLDRNQRATTIFGFTSENGRTGFQCGLHSEAITQVLFTAIVIFALWALLVYFYMRPAPSSSSVQSESVKRESSLHAKTETA